jgi:tetratricopeptide (TPR) repeat protein
MGFYEAAVAENNHAIKNDNLNFWAYLYNSWHLLELGDAEAALQTVKQVEALEPTSPFLAFTLGNIAFFRGDFSQAETRWRPFVQINPSLARATQIFEVALALLAVRKGEIEEGKRVLEKFRDRPGFGNNHLIRLAAAVGEDDLAIRFVRSSQFYRHYRWIIADPDMAALRNNPSFRELLNDLYARWQRDVAAVGPTLSATPPKLPTPQAYLARGSN